MSMLSGINHAAIITADIDRFVAFYTEVFGAEVVFHEESPPLRHAILRIGNGVIHPVEIPQSQHGSGEPHMFQRGHLDHLGLTVISTQAFQELRTRLLARGATDGTVTSTGPQVSFWFTDPDGMQTEACCARSPHLTDFHAPVVVPPRRGL